MKGGRILMIAGLLSTVGFPVAGSAQQAPVVWSAGTGLRWESFDEAQTTLSDWLHASGWVERKSSTGAVRLEGGRHRRFGVWDEQVALDVYRVLWSGAYANVRAAVAPDGETIAEVDAYVEMFQNLAAGWEVAAGFNRLVVGGADPDVQIASVAVGKYAGDWYLRQRIQYVRQLEGGADGVAVNGYARYYVSPLSFIEAGGGAGKSFQYVGRGPDIEIDRRADVYARLEMFPWSSAGVAVETAYHTFDGLPDRFGLALGLLIRR